MTTTHQRKIYPLHVLILHVCLHLKFKFNTKENIHTLATKRGMGEGKIY